MLSLEELQKMTRAEMIVDLRKPTEVSKRAYVLAAILSVIPAETWFKKGKDNLDEKLQRLLYSNREHPLIKEHFPDFGTPYGERSQHLFNQLNFYNPLGRQFGLENWGRDFLYKVTAKTRERTAELVEEGRKEGVLSDKNYNYLRELGERLITD
ncbi:MAG: hypothetical protein AABX28_03450 [Nanoarchaeota archaeon]